MPAGSIQDGRTWHPGAVAEREGLPSPMVHQARPVNEVRIARIDTRQPAAAPGAGGAPSEVPEAGPLGAKIILRTRGRVIVVDEGEIDWIDGAGNYIRVHVGPARHQVRGTLKDAEKVLAAAGGRFVRVHRSTIVNLHSVREFIRTPYGDLIALLRNGQRLAVGRVYRSKIEALLATRL
jgi:two-component system, LytTR family, response regulator